MKRLWQSRSDTIMSNVQISKFLSVEQTMVTQCNQIVNTRGGLVVYFHMRIYALRFIIPSNCNKWLNDCWHQKDGKLFILPPVAFHQIRRKFEGMSNLQGYLLRGVGDVSDWNFNGRIIPSSHDCWLREFSWNGEGSIKFLPQCNILVVEIFGAKSFLQFYEYACLNVCFKLSERNYMQLCIFANIFVQFRVLQITMQFCVSFAQYYMFEQLYPIRFPNAYKS